MIKVTFDGKLNADSVSATDFSVVLDGTGGTFVPANVTVKDAVVYLDIDSTIPSNDTPAVKLVGTVQDLAGNSSSAGTTNALDKLSPVITVAYSGVQEPELQTTKKMLLLEIGTVETPQVLGCFLLEG